MPLLLDVLQVRYAQYDFPTAKRVTGRRAPVRAGGIEGANVEGRARLRPVAISAVRSSPDQVQRSRTSSSTVCGAGLLDLGGAFGQGQRRGGVE